MRQLVTLRTIDDIQPINGADRIEVATVGGWKVVVKKDEFKIGDKAFYFEIDSWIPKRAAPFLCKGEPKYYEGREGALLKTVKLKGQISQGLLLPVDYVESLFLDNKTYISDVSFADRLDIIKYEPENKQTSTSLPFPNYLKKTDQERIQNIDISEYHGSYQVTEKLDGSSMTIFNSEYYQESGVCSRNILFPEGTINSFTQMADKLQILEYLKYQKYSLAIQGELIGPKIQGNPYKLEQNEFYIYNIWDINTQEYWSPADTVEFCMDNGFTHVPIQNDFKIDDKANIEGLLNFADGKSTLNKSVSREGLVFKAYGSQKSFKAISNKWLLKYS